MNIEPNISAVDKFTIAHVFAGMIFGLVMCPIWLLLIIVIVFEAIENPLKDLWIDFFPNQSKESLINMIFDTIFVVIGWGIGILLFTVIF